MKKHQFTIIIIGFVLLLVISIIDLVLQVIEGGPRRTIVASVILIALILANLWMFRIVKKREERER